MQEAGGWTQEAGRGTQDAGSKTQEAGRKMLEARRKMQDAGSKTRDTLYNHTGESRYPVDVKGGRWIPCRGTEWQELCFSIAVRDRFSIEWNVLHLASNNVADGGSRIIPLPAPFWFLLPGSGISRKSRPQRPEPRIRGKPIDNCRWNRKPNRL
jgi:hypothetical protein